MNPLGANPEPCPSCGEGSALRSRLLLIPERLPASKNESLEGRVYPAIDDLVPEILRQPPLKHFVDGIYCERCGKGFLTDDQLKIKLGRRNYGLAKVDRQEGSAVTEG